MTVKRYVIVIGAMKSGTTTLFDLLARHPRIAAARGKEPGYFGLDEAHAKGADWYEGLFGFDPARHDWRLEASTDYTKAPFVETVGARMAAHPEAEFRLIYIMRHPLRRIESHARHVQRAKKEIGQRISPISDHSLDQGLSAVNLAVSDYARQLDRWRDVWDAGHLHLMTLEGLKSDAEGEMARVWDWLGLEPPEGPVLTRSNAADAKVEDHPLWARVTRAAPLLAIGKALLPQRLRRRLRETLKRPVRSEGRFELSLEEEATLFSLYDPGVRRLEREYGLDLTLWDWRDPRSSGTVPSGKRV